MAGRMSALHSPTQLTATQSHPPVSRNGGSSNAAVNGSAIDLRGKRGAYFQVNVGALTGSANYAVYLQTGDNEADSANANWTNVNTTTYANAGFAAKTNANTVWELSYDPVVGGSPQVRAVLVPDANVSVIGITAVTF